MTDMKAYADFRLDLVTNQSVEYTGEKVAAIFPEWDKTALKEMWFHFQIGRHLKYAFDFFRVVMPGAVANLYVEDDKFSVHIQSADYEYESVINGYTLEERVLSGYNVGTVHNDAFTCFLMAMIDAYFAEYLDKKDV